MRFLLDTHTFIWFVMDNSSLSTAAKDLIEDERNEKLLSIVSIWEMAIKHSVGKLSFAQPFQAFIEHQMQRNSMSLLNLKILHVNILATLPLHHRDPFDRLLIAQSIVENLPIVGIDTAFDSYAVQRLWSGENDEQAAG
jgi:PIN domain nuclease of toxin-antitoxin system